MATMTQNVPTTIDSCMPHHSAKISNPPAFYAAVAKVATHFSTAQIKAKLESIERLIGTSNGCEFDDARTRYWMACKAEILRKAIALQQ